MEDDDKKTEVKPDPTPDPPTPPAPPAPPTTDPVPPVTDDVRSAVTALTTKVEELSGMVAGIIATGGGQQDDTPVKKPWTHWGGKR